jgi:hypothetical protein
MKSFVNICFCSIVAIGFIACKDPASTQGQTIKEKNLIAKTFPEDFLGIYLGDLNINSKNGDQTVPMEFHLAGTDEHDHFSYKIYYGQERAERAYHMQRTKDPHRFLIDENNGIILESYYADQVLYSTYEVAGNLLHSTEIFYDDRMEFIIALARVADTTATGTTDSAIVNNYPISVVQKATLYKQRDTIVK